MVDDVAAWLPHSPMLAFDILPSYSGGIGIPPCVRLLAWCAAPPSLGYGGWSFSNNSSFLFFFAGTRTKFYLHSINKFCPMLERATSTCTLSLISTNLFSFLHVLDPKEIPTRRNFGFLVIFSSNIFFLDINLLWASFL
jgi:hypothetical protein